VRPPGRTIPALFVTFVLGAAVGWWIHASMSSRAVPVAPAISVVAPRTVSPPTGDPDRDLAPLPGPVSSAPSIDSDPVAELRRHSLRLPLDTANVDAMNGGFAERRDGNARGHEAVDMLAPRNTPVRAVENGTIARLFFSRAGGNTIYQFDPTQRYCYYYAHLDHYLDGLRDGQSVSKGDVLGYVGTTGNAPRNTPHLHFAIFRLTETHRWWQGTAIDPYLVFKP
jgi:murein DD-endopeptidase MepM/ murein hydrolase activator NlpD